MNRPKLSRTQFPAHPKARRRRRPTGVSRRQRRMNLGFETLEDRRVMSANSPLEVEQVPFGPVQQNVFYSYSSATPEGLAAQLQAEIARYALIESNNGPSEIRARSLPQDELFDNQWYLLNVGQEIGNPVLQNIFGIPGEDINYLGARELGYTGEGVTVAVIDSGVQLDHPDINIHPTLGFDGIDFDNNASPSLIEFDPDDQFSYFPLNAHGTAVAGIIAGLENGEGTVGIAPDSQIIPIRIIDIGQTQQGFIESFQFAAEHADITNNSFGPIDGIRQLAGPSALELLSFQSSVFGPNAGRNGLGTIHVFAAGNGAQGLDSSSYDGYVNSRYTIGVTGVDHDGEYNNIDGTVTGFAEIGPSVLVAAPVGSFSTTIGDDTFIGTGITTTDTTGSTGFNVPALSNGLELDGDFLDPENDAYTNLFGGTSSATPQVAGVIALMLEANPNLGWRDVQDILVRSARQNAPTSTLADGFDKSTGNKFQNTWIQNQVPLFHEPDLYDPLIPNEIQFFNPILDPRVDAPDIALHNHQAPNPQTMTNGAGFTVSQGRGTNNDQIGYAHGVIDAELAVRMAEQWTIKGQTLPAELTFTTTAVNPIPAAGVNTSIPAAHTVNPGGVSLIIPGSLGGGNNWEGYYDEYFAPAPDFTPFLDATRGGPLELTPPQINGQDIIVETVEVLLNIGGTNATSEALDHLRVVLVSPNGTHSELNHYFIDEVGFAPNEFHQTFNPNNINPETGEAFLAPNGLNGVSFSQVDRLSPTPVNGNNLVFNFTSNRSWGERTDDAVVFDPTTNEPFTTLPGAGGNLHNTFLTGAGVGSSVGDLISQGWQLHFENYGTTPLNLNGVEVVWHGSPVNAATERVMGAVGIDEDQSDTFNFSRMIQLPSQDPASFTQVDLDPNTLRLGEVQSLVDPNVESFAPNVTVFAYRDVNDNGTVDNVDILVDQFVTGHDGNYYFDLVPGDYLITTDSDQTFDDELTPDGLLPNYMSTWKITEEFFTVWDYDENLEVPTTDVDGVPTPSAFLDGGGNEVVTGVRHLNFLINPGPEADPFVNFSGIVAADFNGDGIFNTDDVLMPDISVFADVNRNGVLDPGEVLTETNINGEYNLQVPSENIAVIDIGVLTPVDWSIVTPDSPLGTFTFFTQPGDSLVDVDFALQPSSSAGDGTSPTGTIFGTVYEDANQTTIRDANESGVANITVYIDANNSGALEPGEVSATTNQNGAYVFTEVPAGEHLLRIDIASPLSQTSPVGNFPRAVTVNPAGTTLGVSFGVFNSAILDYGDLPAAYGLTTSAQDGARHRRGAYYLGARVDSEIEGLPSVDALGDDNDLDDDEDGVTVQPLTFGPQAADAMGTLTASASRFGGNLNAWIDFNADMVFDESEHVIVDHGLVAGANVVQFELPDNIAETGVFARFRYGSSGMGLTGLDNIGEVEDYLLATVAPPPVDPQDVPHGPDFDEDGDVDGADFLSWQRGYGLLSNALAGNGDADSDGAVDGVDLAMLMRDFGQQAAALQAVSGTSESESDAPVEEVAAALSVELVQPGFREDLVAGVIETSPFDTSASLASELLRLEAVGQSVSTTNVEQQEAVSDEVPIDLGFALLGETRTSDSATSDEVTLSQADDADEDEALAVALSEDIHWRLD